MTNPAKKILLIRNDKLGDFMLAFPSFAMLKQALPDSSIYALVPQYTYDMAQACPNIDHIITDPGPNSNSAQLIQSIKAEKFDAVITLFSTGRIGWIVRRAGIPYRLAPATKLAQIFYNHRLRQRRSRSEKPEYEYNMDLVRQFLMDHKISVPETPTPPFLQFDADEIRQLKHSFCQQHGIDQEAFILFLHCGSGGSANNLSLDQYAKLIEKLAATNLHVVLTAGPGEIEMAKQAASRLAGIPHSIYQSSEGLIQFSQHIQFADLFISGSTGPLHIAAALNRATVAFYPKRRSATALRWQTTNEEPRRLTFTPADDSADGDMRSINLDLAAKQIRDHFL